MNYTISTEPVTRKHFGREVLVKNKNGDMSNLKLGILINLVTGNNPCFFVKFTKNPSTPIYKYQEALLIVDEADKKL